MKCDDVTNSLLRYSEGAMGTFRATIMRLHIARCRSCRDRFAALNDSRRKLSEAMRTPIDAPDMSNSVMACIGTSPRTVSRFRVGWIAVPVAACALIAIFVATRPGPAPVEHTRKHMAASAARPAPPVQQLQPPQHKTRTVTVVRVPHVRKAMRRQVTALRLPTHEAPKAAQQAATQTQLPAPDCTTSTKIVVVVTRRAEPPVSTVQVEATDHVTGRTAYYRATYDAEGSRQSICMADTRLYP